MESGCSRAKYFLCEREGNVLMKIQRFGASYCDSGAFRPSFKISVCERNTVIIAGCRGTA